MRFIADLHIHSRYSRATSREMVPETIWKWSQLKGIKVTGTGDFTHPKWIAELKEKLEPAGNGLLRLKKSFQSAEIPGSCRADVFFMLTAEISCIYRKNGRVRKIHSLVFVPDFESADRINSVLAGKGNIHSDGRPILGLDVKELLKIVLESSPDAMLVPAHAWTPHFSLFGSESGFDSLEECFDELTPQIWAIETGLSSDPAMNRRLSFLDKITLISNSDAHSPSKIGREANIFDTELSYSGIIDALRQGKGSSGTIEFFPEEGKYHYDGHRDCGVSLSPRETERHQGLCPSCGEAVTAGVLHRVEKLADRDAPDDSYCGMTYKMLIPLLEILAETLSVGVNSKRVEREYMRLIENLGSELHILTNISLDEIEGSGSILLREGIDRMRRGAVRIAPGYDGRYGTIKIF